MVADDVVYGSVLLFSLAFGAALKRVQSTTLRKNVCTLVGALVVIYCCKFHSIHTIVTVVVNAIILKYASRSYSHLLSFAWSFGYLAFFRATSYFGIPHPPPLANAVQLFLTLKCVGLVYEVHDTIQPLPDRALSHLSPDKVADLHKKYVAIETNVSWMDIIHYCYSGIGILNGPYYKYRVYQDFITNTKMGDIDSKTPLFKRLSPVPIIVMCYFIATSYFNINDTQTEKFARSPLLWRMFYIMPMFVIFRLRLYISFILSECACIMAGLGAYPAQCKPLYGQGPSDLSALDALHKEKPREPIVYDFTTVRSLDIYLTELGVTVREGMRGWNMSVQYFQVHHVYRRFPIKSLRVIAVMTVTSFWHGLHPGYYLCFLTVPLAVFTDDLYVTLFRKPASPAGKRRFDWIWWILKMRQFEYMSMPFLLLGWNISLQYWSSVYYFMHVLTVGLLVVGLVLKYVFNVGHVDKVGHVQVGKKGHIDGQGDKFGKTD